MLHKKSSKINIALMYEVYTLIFNNQKLVYLLWNNELTLCEDVIILFKTDATT